MLSKKWNKPPLLREVERAKLRPVYAGIAGTLGCLAFVLGAASTAVAAAHYFVIAVQPDVPAEAPYLDMTVTEHVEEEFNINCTLCDSGAFSVRSLLFQGVSSGQEVFSVSTSGEMISRGSVTLGASSADTHTIHGNVVLNGVDVTDALMELAGGAQ